jgi:tetratricopeptide (TPR) repeat protein
MVDQPTEIGLMPAISRHTLPTLARAASLAAILAFAAACSSPEQKLAGYLKSGAAFLEEGRIGQANVQFQNALKIDEDNVEALLGLGEIAERRNDYSQMFGILQRAHRLDPNRRDVQLDLSKLYLLANDADAALDLVEGALTAAPEDADFIAMKAAIMFRLQNTAEAVELARKAVSIDPANQEAATVLASERVLARDNEGALKVLDDAILKSPQSPILQLLRVQILTNLGRSKDIRAAYKSLVEAHPAEATYRRLYVTSLLKAGEVEETRKQLLEVVKLLPNDLNAKLDVVRIDFRIGGFTRATDTFDAFIRDAADGAKQDLEIAYGSFLREQKKFAEADAIYERLINSRDAEIDVIMRAKNERAALRMIEGKEAEAERIVDEILSADRRNQDALMKRATFRIRDQSYDDAIADLRMVENDHPDAVPSKLLMAAALEQKGDFELATAQYARAYDASQRAPSPANLYASYLVRRGDYDRAIRVLMESIAINPGSEENLKLLAALRLQKQDWQGAEDAAKALRASGADSEIVSRILSAAYAGLKDYSNAIDVLAEQNDKKPLAARPLANLIQAYVDADRIGDAERFLRNMIDKNPDHYDGRILVAQVLAHQRRTEEAREYLRQAVDIDEARPEAYEALYRAYVIEGRRVDAGFVIEQGVAAAPQSDGLKILLADNHIALGRNDAAAALYEEILVRRPNDLIVANNLASILSDRDDQKSRARALAVAAPLKGATNGYFLDTYGWALFRNGRIDEAIAALEKAAVIDGAPLEARLHLAQALMAKGETARAREQLEAVVSATGAPEALVVEARRLLAK